MTTQTSAAIDTVRKSIEAFNKQDAAAYAALCATDASVADPFYAEPLRGRAAIEQDLRDFFKALPDVQLTISNMLGSESTVAIEGVVLGTHSGPLLGPDGSTIPPTGRTLRMPVAVFSRVDSDGLVAAEQRYFDVAGVMAQLGLG